MKMSVENLGYIAKGEMELGDLTVIVGKNNTGKTYLSYALIYFLATFHSNIVIDESELDKENQLVINFDFLAKKISAVSKECSRAIYKAFACEKERFKNTKLDFSLDVNDMLSFMKNKVKQTYHDVPIKDLASIEVIGYIKNEEIVLKCSISNAERDTISFFNQKKFQAMMLSESLGNLLKDYIEVFPVSSERTGIALFYKELDYTKNMILDLLKEKDFSRKKYMDVVNQSVARYAFPIRENINSVRSADTMKEKSFLWQSKKKYKTLFSIWSRLVSGIFATNGESIIYTDNKANQEIPLHVISSANKSLLLLDIFIKHRAKPHHILIIDEPEMNLHPEAQRDMARLLVQLVNAGVKIVITTHSDYIIRELNNLMMISALKSTKVRKILRELGYDSDEILMFQQVKAYMCDQHKIHTIEKNTYGLNISSFDGFINKSNEISDSIVEMLETN